MAERSPYRIWGLRAGFVLLGFVIVLVQLLPFETIPAWWRPLLLQTDPLTPDMLGKLGPGSNVKQILFQPLETPFRWIAPDSLLAFCLAWSVRRPELVPSLLIGGIVLFADFLLMRPPGLLALVVVLACEWLKRRSKSMRTMPFLLEWALIGAVIAAIFVANRLVLAMMLLELPPFGVSLAQSILTFAAYPVVVLLSNLVFGVRKQSIAESNMRGWGA